jgi:hypothetical protein
MEPSFLDNEAITDNLNDEQASKVIAWLIRVFHEAPEKIDQALNTAKNINTLIILDPNYFNQLMTQLEENINE